LSRSLHTPRRHLMALVTGRHTTPSMGTSTSGAGCGHTAKPDGQTRRTAQGHSYDTPRARGCCSCSAERQRTSWAHQVAAGPALDTRRPWWPTRETTHRGRSGWCLSGRSGRGSHHNPAPRAAAAEGLCWHHRRSCCCELRVCTARARLRSPPRYRTATGRGDSAGATLQLPCWSEVSEGHHVAAGGKPLPAGAARLGLEVCA
jgi:hypothetical protein